MKKYEYMYQLLSDWKKAEQERIKLAQDGHFPSEVHKAAMRASREMCQLVDFFNRTPIESMADEIDFSPMAEPLNSKSKAKFPSTFTPDDPVTCPHSWKLDGLTDEWYCSKCGTNKGYTHPDYKPACAHIWVACAFTGNVVCVLCRDIQPTSEALAKHD